jgi:hypothetical protein
MSSNVLRKIDLRVPSKYGFSHAYLKSLIFSTAGKNPKFIEPMLHDAISAETSNAPASRSPSVIVSEPPVVIFKTASVAA